MTRRLRTAAFVAAGAAVVALVVAWGVVRSRPDAREEGDAAPRDAPRPASIADGQAAGPVRAARPPFSAAPGDPGVTIAGRVIDVRQQRPVGDVEVVFRGAGGDASAATHSDGGYAIRLAAGTYRAFVRDTNMLSVGRPDRVRLPDLPAAETAGVPDEALMAVVVASGDADGVDLSVVRGGVVSGRVVDRDGRPIAGAVLRARNDGVRPTLATDVATSGADGAFTLRLPAGVFELEASHPRFAGPVTRAAARITVQPGDHVMSLLTLTAGCVIEGRVVGHDGTATGDGAIELQWGPGDQQFAPAGRIAPDGSFRWTTTEEHDITLRAWPWRSPASPPRRFACRDGARFDAVFQIPEGRPDLEGVLVDPHGAPVGFAFIDLMPLDPGNVAQQERSDADGRWAVYDVTPGRYRVVAHADDRGIAATTVVSPRNGIRLALGGTGRLAGTTSRLASGSFELVLGTCLDATGQIPLPQSRRLVTVTGGRFSVDDIPACQLAFDAVWHGQPTSQQVAIPSGGTARVELDLGPPRNKRVHGTVRDETGKPLAGAQVAASHRGEVVASARTDAAGSYTLKTVSGASLRASLGERTGFAEVGGANIDAEQVDVVVTDADSDRP